jgi:hypothetical protein
MAQQGSAVAIARDDSLLIAVGGPAGDSNQGATWAGYWRAPCTTCPAGKECSNPLVPTDCPVGYYCLAGALPVACSLGSYCPAGTGIVNPPCPAGSFCVNSSIAAPCPLGYWSATVRLKAATQCTACNPGKFGNATTVVRDTEADSCALCNVGFYCLGADSPEVVCSLGSNCLGGSPDDTPCDQGQYCTSTTATPIDCPLGRFGNRPGLTALSQCLYCNPGKYSSGATGQTTQAAACTDCPIGSYSTATGALSSTTCTACAAGKVGTKEGATSSGCVAPCTATPSAPALGALGECQGTSSGNYNCWPTCPVRYALTGPSTCTGTTFTSAQCGNCTAGQLYTSSVSSGLVKYRETGVGTSQGQGSSVVISADGRVMVQAAKGDNSNRGSQGDTCASDSKRTWGTRMHAELR